MGSVYVGTQKAKKIYVGTQPVKKIYVGKTLCWSANETGSWNIGSYYTKWGGGHFQLDIYITGLEKDYANNRLRLKVEMGIRSLGNWTISSNTNKTGTIKIDGQSYSFNYTAGLSKGQYKIIFNRSDIWINNASGKTINVNASVPINITLSGVGAVNTVNASHSVKLPTL